MTPSEATEQTTLVFFQVEDAGGIRHYQASVLRTHYHGARPGDDVVQQIEHVGYVCAISPGTRVETVHEIRSPRATAKEVETEILDFLAKRHGVPVEGVVETARHVFE